MDRLFEDGEPKVFACDITGEWIFVDKENKITTGSDDWKWGEISELAGQMNSFFDDLLSQPSGGLGGRVAAGPVAVAVIWFPKNVALPFALGVAANLAVKNCESDSSESNETPPSKEEDTYEGPVTEPLEDDETNSGTRREPDESGTDLLVFLMEVKKQAEFDDAFKEMVSGRITPPETDIEREFIQWLVSTVKEDDAILQALQNNEPIPEDDDTRYTLHYWLWRQLKNQPPHQYDMLYYFWRRGAPIDPVEYGLQSMKMKFIAGTLNQKRQRMEFSFIG